MSIVSHLPALQVVIPLLASPICVIAKHPRATWAIAFAVSSVAFLIACALLYQVRAEGAISYALGGWAHPWGIEYRVDDLSAIPTVVIADDELADTKHAAGRSGGEVLLALLSQLKRSVGRKSGAAVNIGKSDHAHQGPEIVSAGDEFLGEEIASIAKEKGKTGYNSSC